MTNQRNVHLFGNPQRAQKERSEEFFSLPDARQLMHTSGNPREGLDKWIVNTHIVSDDRFTLEAPDNRMADAGIRKDDVVIVRQHRDYRDGDLVAVQLGDRLLIRRFYRVAQRIRLECTNPDRQSMIIDENTPGFTMLGRVVQVIKEF